METYTTFSKDEFEAFLADTREGPIHMLNLIRLREVTEGEGGVRRTGRAAYAEYSRISAPVFAGLGGRIVWRGRFEFGLIAPPHERWDICFIAEYPSVAAFASMLRDPTYRAAMKHRQMAVLDSRLIRLEPQEAGATFGGEVPGDEQPRKGIVSDLAASPGPES